MTLTEARLSGEMRAALSQFASPGNRMLITAWADRVQELEARLTLGEPPDGTEICGAGKHFTDAGYPCPECAKS